MKRILLLLAIVGMTTFQSCSNDDDRVDNDTVALVFDVNKSFNAQGEIIFPFNAGEVFSGDVVLIYWMESTTTSGNPIWRLIPQNISFPNNEYPGVSGLLTYNYDFTTTEATIWTETNINLASIPNYTVGQFFRIVVVPGQNPIFARTSENTGKSVAQTVDYNDYNAVVKAFGIKEQNIKTRK
ncbi:hypothetical protein [Flavobacterium microcysteis]|uniref:Uncharacterized protein n=1 Tax=Flavobacterium microcysteis TaxID=2596891 RepID=A0A501Q3K6_9FLAO|nr:hypothetical protein [Flavobacterium microcysteis]TPD66948.1 hypothetical protein FJA49_11745 [Flavobacterium microcysteis]